MKATTAVACQSPNLNLRSLLLGNLGALPALVVCAALALVLFSPPLPRFELSRPRLAARLSALAERRARDRPHERSREIIAGMGDEVWARQAASALFGGAIATSPGSSVPPNHDRSIAAGRGACPAFETVASSAPPPSKLTSSPAVPPRTPPLPSFASRQAAAPRAPRRSRRGRRGGRRFAIARIPLGVPSDASGPGLRAGEVVAFAVDGLPYVCDRDATGAAIGFGPSALEDAVSIADPATHLVVVRSGRFLGFRSDAACGGKMLQATQRAKGRLCFFNLNHGVNEQWEAADEGPPEGPADWKSRPVRLKNRRFPGCVLRVDVMRVPSEISGVAAPEIDDDLRGTHRARGPSTTKTPGSSFSADGVRRAVAFHERSIDDAGARRSGAGAGTRDVSPAAWERDAPDDPGAKARELSGKARGGDGTTHGGSASSPGDALGGGNTQTHALKSMSGVMIKEWSAFVLKEVRARKAVEAQMVALREETREWLAGFKAEVKKTKAEWVDDATYIGAAARAAREANERQRRAVASMARRTLFKRTQAAAFRRWAARARENAKRRVVVTRAVARIARFRLAAPFATWLDWTRRIKRVRAVAAKVSGLANARAALALGAWRRAALSTAAAGGGTKLVRTLQTRAVAKMRRGALASAFGGWRAKVTELRRVRRAATMVAAGGRRRRRRRVFRVVRRRPRESQEEAASERPVASGVEPQRARAFRALGAGREATPAGAAPGSRRRRAFGARGREAGVSRVGRRRRRGGEPEASRVGVRASVRGQVGHRQHRARVRAVGGARGAAVGGEEARRGGFAAVAGAGFAGGVLGVGDADAVRPRRAGQRGVIRGAADACGGAQGARAVARVRREAGALRRASARRSFGGARRGRRRRLTGGGRGGGAKARRKRRRRSCGA